MHNSPCRLSGRRRRARPHLVATLALSAFGLTDAGLGRVSLPPALPSADAAARALNSVGFLRELVGAKSTSDASYYTRPLVAVRDSGDPSGLARADSGGRLAPTDISAGDMCLSLGGPREPARAEREKSSKGWTVLIKAAPSSVRDPLSYESTCEYTGRLWFLRGKGIRFRETVRVSELTPSSARVECDTQYLTRRRWADCSRIVCDISSVASSGDFRQGSRMDCVVDCEILAGVPLPGVAGRAVRRKIISVFESAVLSFFGEAND